MCHDNKVRKESGDVASFTVETQTGKMTLFRIQPFTPRTGQCIHVFSSSENTVPYIKV